MSKLVKMVEEKGYIYYDWNAENGDGYSKMSKKEMLRRATSSSEKKIMILMHDANGSYQMSLNIIKNVDILLKQLMIQHLYHIKE